MKEADAIKLMADIGPNAKDALESWVTLQWAEFVMGYVVGFVFLGIIAAGVYVFVRAALQDTVNGRR